MSTRNGTFLTLAVVATAIVVMSATFASAAIISPSGLAIDSTPEFQWPTSTLLGGQEQASTAYSSSAGYGVKSSRVFGQSFTITQDGTIDLIAFNFQRNDANGDDFTFEFYKVTSASDHTMVGSVIDTATVSAADITALGFDSEPGSFFYADAWGTLVFDVTDTAVSAGDVYAMELNAGTDYIFSVRRGATITGELWGTYTSPDIFVAAYAVPEPATMSLLAIGGLGVLLKRRRRRA